MLGIAAHDLKNPLTVVRGFAELLEMKTPDAAGRDMAARILRSADAMLGIVTRLLDSAALESGQLEIASERVDLARVVAEVIDANRPQAERKQQSLAAELGPGLAVTGDAARLAQVVDNLVGNAIKYSPAARPVHVRLHGRDGHAVLQVEDQGPGFAADDRDKLFRRFSRLSARPTGGESSSGLGLSIVKQLAELHGGTVDARSPGPGLGATFELRLPLAPPPRESAAS
ncbi:MAG: HAMP domain-containing histidine kinase [Vicinamibacteria bacterium]|nr:HAMP domain-containing histidine kinase [Vicinamibacteria bacterium]